MQRITREQWQEAGEFLRFVGQNFLRDDCRRNAAALTYTTLFAVVPVMTVTFAILSAIPAMSEISVDVQNFVFRHFVPSSGELVEQYLKDFAAQAGRLTVVGAGILFITALSMLLTIEGAFNNIWRVRQSRKGIVSFLRYWAVLSLGPLLLGVGFAVSSYVTSIDILSRTASFVSNIIPGLRLIPLVFSAMAFTLLYVAVPNCKVPLRAGMYGGITAAFMFEAAKKGFGIFVTHFSSYKLVYGAFAAVPIFLLWIYLSWIIILLGVEITRALVVFRGRDRGHKHPVLTLLDLLDLFYRRQQTGGVVSDVAAIKVIGRQDSEEWADFARILQEQHLISKTEEGDYVLSRNLDHLDFWAFYRKLPWPLPQPQDLLALEAESHWAATLRPLLEQAGAQLEQGLSIPLGGLFSTGSGHVVKQEPGA